MEYCKNCGVELDADMTYCPLCGTSVSEGAASNKKIIHAYVDSEQERHLLQRVLWQIVSIILLTGIVSTLVIDIAMNSAVSWSIYPVTASMIVFSYVSLLAFWHTRLIFQILGGWFISSALLFVLHFLSAGTQWSIQLGIPILFAVNLIVLIFHWAIRHTKNRILNLLIYTFVAITLLCISIEVVLSLYKYDGIRLRWSVIVGGCLLPITVALLFMYHRTKKNADLQKIFHT